MNGFLAGLRGTRAETDPCSADARLRGRTYAIPFDRVWTAALRLAQGGLARWEVVTGDDQQGIIEVVATSWPLGKQDDVRIRIGLDANGQTRVDLVSAARADKPDLGRNARRVRSFLRKLDATLDAGPAQILDPTRTATWTT